MGWACFAESQTANELVNLGIQIFRRSSPLEFRSNFMRDHLQRQAQILNSYDPAGATQ